MLNLQITPDMLLLLLNRDDVLPAAEREAEEVREAADHRNRLADFARFDEPDDGIQRVIQKMRVDLRLQQRKLRAPLLLLLLRVALDKALEVADHALNAVREQLHLLDIRLYRLADE